MTTRVLVGLIATAIVATPAAAQLDQRLSIHGHITQAYGVAHGGTFTGIPEGGTGDYRNAALQFRYALTDRDNVTLQFSHRRLGENPVVQGESDVMLDWAFFGKAFGDLDVRIGRIPIPAGIYNEVRDAGVVLPLYRAPFNFYLEGAFTSETVDGAVATYRFFPNSAWNIELSGYVGGFEMINRVQIDTEYVGERVRMEGAVGGQLWLNTGLEGLRFGFGANREQVGEGAFEGEWTGWHGSLDASFDRFTLRGEYRAIMPTDIDYRAYYAYLGIMVTPRLGVHGQADFADITIDPLPKADFNTDYTVGASFAFMPNLVLKGEAHFTDGFWADVPVLNPVTDAAADVNYFVVSLSTSF